MTDDLVSVRLIGIPVPLVLQAREHWDSLIRELAIIALDARPSERSHVPNRLSAIARLLGREYAHLLTRDLDAVDAALESDEDTFDLSYDVPPAGRALCIELDGLLEEADAYCRDEKLLTPSASAEIRAYRRWVYAEFIRQIDGEPPTPWPNARERYLVV